MSRKGIRPLFGVLLAAAAVAARLPFLVSGKIPFDSDEAVEGLMAVHVLNGELPAFFWGQAFKGVPEVYAAAGAFALFGGTVTVLKSVTLAVFAAYVAVNFVLLDRILSRWVAVAASLLLIFCPPPLVLWSLSASAEYVLIMLLGTILLLLCLRVEQAGGAEGRARSTDANVLGGIGVIVGLGLWVHQLFVAYLFPVALILTLQTEWWKRRNFGRPGKAVLALGAVGALYLALGVIAFFTGGFSLQLGSVAISATAPQKMLRIAAGVFVLAGLLHAAATITRDRARALAYSYWPLGIGVLVGYLPVLLYSLLVEPARSPARVANASQLLAAAPDILANIVPIVAGFKLPTTERLALPLLAAVPGLASLMAFLWSNRRRIGQLVALRAHDPSLAHDFFPMFILFLPGLFLVSAAHVDTQSYRYLIPWYAGLSVAWAAGSLALARRKVLASLVVGAMIAVHGWQQILWHDKLAPDTQSLAVLDCLRRHGIRGGYAEYWTSYKLTFLAREEIIIAPTTGIDRYPAYTDFVRSLPSEERISDAAGCER